MNEWIPQRVHRPRAAGRERETVEQFLHYHKQIFSVMFLLCFVALAGMAAGAAGDASYAPYALGFGLGAAAQLLKFRCVDSAVIRKIAVEKKDAAAVQLKAMGGSLLLFGIAVAAAHRWGGDIWAMAAGIFLPRLVLVADAWIRPNPFRTEDAEMP